MQTCTAIFFCQKPNVQRPKSLYYTYNRYTIIRVKALEALNSINNKIKG